MLRTSGRDRKHLRRGAKWREPAKQFEMESAIDSIKCFGQIG